MRTRRTSRFGSEPQWLESANYAGQAESASQKLIMALTSMSLPLQMNCVLYIDEPTLSIIVAPSMGLGHTHKRKSSSRLTIYQAVSS